MLCVKAAIIEVIFKCNSPFLRSVSHTMGYSTPKTLLSLPCVLTLFRLATGWPVRGSNLVGRDFSLPVQTDPEVHPASCIVGTGYLSRGQSGRRVALTIHSCLAPRLKKEYSYSYTPLRGLHGLLQGELYLLLTLFKDTVSINRLIRPEICV